MGTPLDRSNRFLSGPPTKFETAFPELEDISIAYRETGKGVSRLLGEPGSPETQLGRTASLRTTGGLIRCSNPLCSRGGYEVDYDAHDLLRRKLVTKEFTRRCPGDEGSPKGRRPGPKCLNALHFKLTLKYKPEQAPARVRLKDQISSLAFAACPACKYPLIEDKCIEGPRLSCGQHVFGPAPHGKLELVSRTDNGWWPKVGEQIEAGGRAWVDCLKLDVRSANGLIDGTASPELRTTAQSCCSGNVPILFETDGIFWQVRCEGKTFKRTVLEGADLRRFC